MSETERMEQLLERAGVTLRGLPTETEIGEDPEFERRYKALRAAMDEAAFCYPVTYAMRQRELVERLVCALDILSGELDKTRAEREALMRDLKEIDRYACEKCGHNSECEHVCPECDCDCENCVLPCWCKDCIDQSNWIWQGEKQKEATP